MKYYTIERVVKNGETIQAIFERETIDIAKKEYHNTFTYNINQDGVEVVSAAILDEDLNMLMKETWKAPNPPKSEIQSQLDLMSE